MLLNFTLMPQGGIKVKYATLISNKNLDFSLSLQNTVHIPSKSDSEPNSIYFKEIAASGYNPPSIPIYRSGTSPSS